MAMARSFTIFFGKAQIRVTRALFAAADRSVEAPVRVHRVDAVHGLVADRDDSHAHAGQRGARPDALLPVVATFKSYAFVSITCTTSDLHMASEGCCCALSSTT